MRCWRKHTLSNEIISLLKIIFAPRFNSLNKIRLAGSYEALSGGQASEALQDFSGGLVEMIDLKDTKLDVLKVMEQAHRRHSFMSCSLRVNQKVFSHEFPEKLNLTTGSSESKGSSTERWISSGTCILCDCSPQSRSHN